MKDEVLEDIKTLKAYIGGVVAFAMAIGAFLVLVLKTDTATTTVCVAGVAALVLVLGFLMQRSENRQKAALKAHVETSNAIVKEMHENMLENQRSNLRTEMNLMMFTNPENHDTILRMAYRYFVELQGDWVETDLFLSWVEREEDAGRRVHVPAGIADVVKTLRTKEHN